MGWPLDVNSALLEPEDDGVIQSIIARVDVNRIAGMHRVGGEEAFKACHRLARGFAVVGIISDSRRVLISHRGTIVDEVDRALGRDLERAI